MRKLAALAPAALLALAGCGALGDTCSTQPGNVKSLANQCTSLRAGAAVTISVRLCPTCAETSPGCSGEVLSGNEIQLNTFVRVCESNAGCPVTSCLLQPVPCSLPALPAGTYSVLYPVETGAARVDGVIVSSGGSTSCVL